MASQPEPQLAERVLRHLTGARWFAGKGRQAVLRSLTPLPWITETAEFGSPSAGPAVRFEIAEVEYPPEEDVDAATDLSTSREYYQLALSFRRAPNEDLHHAEVARFTDPDLGPVVAYDAPQDPEACRVIVAALLDETRRRDREDSVVFHLSDPGKLTTEIEPRFFTGQQSNTSVMFGEVAMLKLFRRLELGRNLDIEVHHALNAAGVHDVAGLFGWVEASWVADGQTLNADLAMVVEKLSDAVDGWELALDRLRAGTDFTAEAAALGIALAETHSALREAFPTSQELGVTTAKVMKERLHRTAVVAPALSPYVEGLNRCFDALADRTLDTQRVHGDFHLGQTLHTPTGWKIIDFEGEPAKSMAERVAPDSIWRDIAGMLRSFDYAAATVPGPDSASWSAACREAFLKGYAGGDLDPGTAAPLRAYEAEKAIYEVGYEVRNRPDWVAIPLGAIAGLADGGQAGGTATATETDHEPEGNPVSPTMSSTTEQE
jgi:maltokinase